jgi:hypothetical protein
MDFDFKTCFTILDLEDYLLTTNSKMSCSYSIAIFFNVTKYY